MSTQTCAESNRYIKLNCLIHVGTHLVSRGAVVGCGTAPDHDEGVEEVALEGGGAERGVVGLQEDHAHDVVADVTLALELRKIKIFITVLDFVLDEKFSF